MGKQEILLETGTNEFEMLEFFIDEATTKEGDPERGFFGMNVAKVVEVIESPNLETRDYAVNPSFLGTIPLRDQVLPVIDLSVWLGIKRKKHDHENIVVTQFSNTIQGFLVSGVVEIHRLTWKELIPPGKFIRHMNTKSIIGMVDLGNYFIQLLDLEHIVSDLNPRLAEETWKTSVVSSKSHKALVADDSPTIRKMLEKNLTAANFQTIIVDNGEEAYRYLLDLKEQASAENKGIKEYLDIVISDIEMPLLDGFTLTRNIKEDPALQKLPVILYSSIITDELRHKGESVKADFQVAKPDMNKMAETAIELIEKYQN
ncbi:MAG: chemotaxis protein CheV [Deltaproteobacteria bacterium]|nr:chemotaxis protein CheV [Deltaproteobacteria bacterium]MBT4263558.1 chemotaxis protein CheV [Deltaproteobacteria bacterium]MBT4644668.1 chemotaxis protein CheV [Deltaproteobacteria bacterium]MBT7714474.1 chemotaxis protein CheV [Deltaproteobacteria bacterium]MBT7891763.1 chemotaxis protein CheV [Deltaproteobacteria bacterium]